MSRLFDNDALAIATIWAEARSEPAEGKIAVGEVILNRMRLRYFSKGRVASTVFHALQFSCFNSDNPWRDSIFDLEWGSPAVEECREAWRLAQSSQSVGAAVLYHTVAAPPGYENHWPPRWASAPGVVKVTTIAHHVFYEDRGAFTP